jgi:hypothetical protein
MFRACLLPQMPEFYADAQHGTVPQPEPKNGFNGDSLKSRSSPLIGCLRQQLPRPCVSHCNKQHDQLSQNTSIWRLRWPRDFLPCTARRTLFVVVTMA